MENSYKWHSQGKSDARADPRHLPDAGRYDQAVNGIGMGIAAMVVLIGSNVVISLLKKVIPDSVRIPCYIVVIAAFVTIVQFLVKAYAPSLDTAARRLSAADCC